MWVWQETPAPYSAQASFQEVSIDYRSPPVGLIRPPYGSSLGAVCPQTPRYRRLIDTSAVPFFGPADRPKAPRQPLIASDDALGCRKRRRGRDVIHAARRPVSQGHRPNVV